MVGIQIGAATMENSVEAPKKKLRKRKRSFEILLHVGLRNNYVTEVLIILFWV